MNRSSSLSGFGIALLALATIAPAQAPASEVAQTSYEMVIVGNRAFGSLIVNGHHQKAIGRITGRPKGDPFAAATNLCVAHAMLGRLIEAALFCDQAINEAQLASRPKPRYLKGRIQVASNWALAYSNRGVLRAMRGDETGAEADFRKAIELRADMRAPANNFARLEMKSTEPIALSVSQH